MTGTHYPTREDCGIRTAQAIIGGWAEATFPEQTTEGIINHILEEVQELQAAQERADPKGIQEEAADLAILLLVLAQNAGFSLYEAITAKHTLNKTRRWGPPDDQGVHHHLGRSE